MEIYLTNVAERWKNELDNADCSVSIFTPYLSSPTAKEIVEHISHPEKCNIYTLFESYNFAVGSSDINTLSTLQDMGFNLFHLPKLHAKIILIHGKFVSIGSQNVTNAGQERREATICTSSNQAIKQVENDVQNWLIDRVEITASMIQTMKEYLPDLLSLVNELKSSSVSIDKIVEMKKTIAILKFNKRKKKLARSLMETRKLHLRLSGTVYKRINDSYYLKPNDKGFVSTISEEFSREKNYNIKLPNLERYPIINKNTGQLSWCRVSETSISRFFTGWFLEEEIENKKIRFSVDVTNSYLINRQNFTINLKDSNSDEKQSEELDFGGWITPNSLDLDLDPDLIPKNALSEWVLQNKEAITETIKHLILSSFKPSKPLESSEALANDFFGPEKSKHIIEIYLFDDKYPILVSSPENY